MDSYKVSIKKFIAAVRRFSYLYDQSSNDTDLREAAWEKIAQTLQADVPACKNKWKNLRDYYNAYLTKRSPPGKKTKKWIHAADMEFLKPYLTKRQPTVGFWNAKPVPMQVYIKEEEEEEEEEDYSPHRTRTTNKRRGRPRATHHSENEDADPSVRPPHDMDIETTPVAAKHDTTAQHFLPASSNYSFGEECPLSSRNNSVEITKLRPSSSTHDLASCSVVPKEEFFEMSDIRCVPSPPDTCVEHQHMSDDSQSGASRVSVVSQRDDEGNKRLAEDACKRDSTDWYFLSLADVVKKLPPYVQSSVKLQLSQVVFTAEMKYNLQSAGLDPTNRSFPDSAAPPDM